MTDYDARARYLVDATEKARNAYSTDIAMVETLYPSDTRARNERIAEARTVFDQQINQIMSKYLGLP